MFPPAPGRLSTSRFCFRLALNCSLASRMMKSFGAPGGNAGIAVTGRTGHVCAGAAWLARTSEARAAWKRLDLRCMLLSWGGGKRRSPNADPGADARFVRCALVHLAIAHGRVDATLPQPVEERA